MNPEDKSVNTNYDDKYSRGLRKLAKESAEIRNSYKANDEFSDTATRVEELDQQASEHYKKNKNKYQRLAFEDATLNGVYIFRDGKSNISELIEQGTEVIPGATVEELRLIDEESRLFDQDLLFEIQQKVKELISRGEVEKSRQPIDELINLIKIRRELEKTIKKSESNLLPFKLELKFKEDSYTRKYLEDLGLTTEVQNKLFEAWSTFTPEIIPALGVIKNSEYNKKKSAYMANEILAISRYVESYGIEEMNEVMDTFGIVYFGRYEKETLHNQLVQWHDGTVKPVNIAITAQSDHNGALSGVESEVVGSSQDREGTFFFEVKDSLQMAKFLVSVGSRERRNGRNPQENGSVRNLIISAHGSPDGISLGTRDQGLAVGDYRRPDTQLKREINTYRNHLGSNFRVILLSCSTAGVNGIDRSIAETISDEHDTLVKASMSTVYGVSVPASTGVAAFEVSKDGKVGRASVFDGRAGIGVKPSFGYPNAIVKFQSDLSRFIRFLLDR
jgi:hypothetical protein